MDHTNPESIKQHLRAMIMVFLGLLFLTVVTVAASFLELSTPATVSIALVIASIKGFLVAANFMHLISEKQLTFLVLAICVVFFFAMILLPLFQVVDTVSL